MLGFWMVFAGVFGVWVIFRERYEPGRWLGTLCWIAFAALSELASSVMGDISLAHPFLATWGAARLVGAFRERRVRHAGGKQGAGEPLGEEGGAPGSAASRKICFGFNASVLGFFALAIVLRLVTVRLGSGF